ncbi:MAG: ADP-ribosylglycohydrolase family protein, partial [Verrucomicrobiales bacterium]
MPDPTAVRDLILPAFSGDALALGPHWIYDAEEIARLYPQGVSTYDAPRSAYHSGKQAGDFTHYGDQT